MKKAKTVRCGIIGYGGAFTMGKAHSNWINAVPGMQAVAVCDIDPARTDAARQDFPDISTFNCNEDMIARDDIDLCVLITPHNTHAPLAIQCLKAGKHVITEKPMCITVDEATAMIEAAKASGVMLSVFHNRRHDGDFLAIKEVIQKGVIGEVFHIEANGSGYGHPGKWWRADKDISGGALYDWGAHFVYWILNLIPEKMESVTGFFHKRVWMDITNEDHTQAIIRFQNGAYADLQISSIACAPKPRWRILGTKGGILDEGGGKFKVFTEVAGYPAQLEVPYKPTDWQAYYNNIGDHLLRGKKLEVPPEDARRVITVIETAEKSAKSGKAEPVPFE
ncbi:MAG: Gfo/Idh/MocA family oxidoreductase [Armatimonadetes bacterium]|nr:Gfo/Idh/MocA family oxidoreductase [Armatimonadota bacterium]